MESRRNKRFLSSKTFLGLAYQIKPCRLLVLLFFFCALFQCFLSSNAASSSNTSDSKIEGRNVTVNGAKLDSAVDEIQWCGTDHSTLLLRTIQNRLYRSFDSGKTWNDISDLFRVSKDGEEEIVEVESISVNPIDKNVVVVFCNRTTALISENAAKTFRRIKSQHKFHSWMFHPQKSTWALLAGISEECYQHQVSDSSDCNRRLFITKDLGRSLSHVSNYVVQFNWGDHKHSQEDRIYFTRHRFQKGNQFTVGGWSSDVDFLYTDNFGKSTIILIPSGNKFVISNEYIFVAAADDIAKQTVKMKVSTDGGKTFTTSQLSTEIQQKSYSVLDVSEGAIMLHVNHGEDGKSDTGNVYVSDASGTHFSLSLPGNIRTATGECEFDKVMSLEGVYLANFKEELEREQSSADRMEDSIIEDEEENSATEVEKKRRPKAKGKTEEVVRTVVSFDKGGAWYYIKPPEQDSLGHTVECVSKHCSLHLHGITTFTQYAPFYSMENAVGIILSTGNVGSHLSYDPLVVNTYLSRDGGLHWIEIHKGAYIYEIGDHGGLLVMADDIHPTTKVVFSWNEGRSWYDFDLNGGPIEVNNIVIEPNSSTLEFLLYGSRGEEGVIYHLDFKSLGQKICRGIDDANTWNSDYETWIPSDGRGGNCILGKQIMYTRRRSLAECFHGKNFQRPKQEKVCACTKEDYECGLGFVRHVGSLECIPENPMMHLEQCTSSSYVMLDAYTKVPGDVCESGWIPEKVAIPCPHHAPFSRSAKLILFLIFAIAVTMWSATYLSKNPKTKHYLRNYGFSRFKDVQYDPMGRKDDDASFYYMDNSKYEPELGFIEAEQDEHEEDAPTLISYPPQRNRDLVDFDTHFTFNGSNSRPTRRNVNEAIPRIPPPPSGNSTLFEGDSIELL